MKKLLFWLFLLSITTSCQSNELKSQLPESILSNPSKTPIITAQSLPKYLGFVTPKPDEIMTLAEYRGLAPSLYWGATEPGICFSISPFYFMEPGDFPSA